MKSRLLAAWAGRGREATERRLRREREDTLKLVRGQLIGEVLEERMRGAHRIPLGLDRRSGAVEWHPLREGATVTDVFDWADGALLISGAPGSGKTIALLELLRDLLARAEQDPERPMPMRLNLQSWTQGQPLAGWIVDELHRTYGVNRRIGKRWVGEDDILPLLDDLDRVAREAQAGCVAAINEFRRTHAGRLVVCGSTEYDALAAGLRVEEAVTLHPPTREQIRAYLDKVGAPLADVQRALGAGGNDGLWELLESPLMLDIVARTHNGRPADDLITDTGDRRERLFAEYSERTLKEPPLAGYTEADARRWLRWVARRLRDHDPREELHLDRLQPVTAREQRRVIMLAAVAAGPLFGLGGGIVLGVIGGLVAERVLGLAGGLLEGLLYGVVGGLVAAVLGGWAAAGRGPGHGYRAFEGLEWSWSGLAFGLAAGPAAGLVFGAPSAEAGLFIGLLAGLGAMVLAARMGGEPSREKASRPYALIRRAGELPWRGGSVAGLISGLAAGLAGGLAVGWPFGLAFGLLAGVTAAQLTVRLRGGRAGKGSVRVTALPRSWARPVVGLMSCLVVGLGAGLIVSQDVAPSLGLIAGLLSGSLTALLAALVGGGRAGEPARGDVGARPAPRDEEISRRFWRMAAALLVGLLFGLPFSSVVGPIGGGLLGVTVGLVSGLAAFTGGGPAVGVPAGLVLALLGAASSSRSPETAGAIAGLVAGLASGLLTADGRGAELFRRREKARDREFIEPVETMHWGWPGVGAGLVLGLLTGLGMGLISGEPVVGLVTGPGLALIMGTAAGWSASLIPKRVKPNHGIHRSARHGLGMGLLGGLAFGLMGGALVGFDRGPVVGLVFGLFSGLLGALHAGLLFGGNACLRHLALRALLAHDGVAPRRYVRFLDDMAHRRLLLRTGGGYLFFHGLLRDHFTGEQPATTEHDASSVPPDDQCRPV